MHYATINVYVICAINLYEVYFNRVVYYLVILKLIIFVKFRPYNIYLYTYISSIFQMSFALDIKEIIPELFCFRISSRFASKNILYMFK